MLQVRSWVAGARPKLDDLIQITPAPLPDRDRFLTDWIAFLRGLDGGDADAWLREAVWLAQGTAGLAALAQNEGKRGREPTWIGSARWRRRINRGKC